MKNRLKIFYCASIIIFILNQSSYCMELSTKQSSTLDLNKEKIEAQNFDICTFMIWISEKNIEAQKMNMNHYYQLIEIHAQMTWIPSEYQNDLLEEIGLHIENNGKFFKKKRLYESYITDCFEAFQIIFIYNINYYFNSEKIVNDYKEALGNITKLFLKIEDSILRKTKIALLRYISSRNPIKFINEAYPFYIALEEIDEGETNIIEKDRKKTYDNIRTVLRNCH